MMLEPFGKGIMGTTSRVIINVRCGGLFLETPLIRRTDSAGAAELRVGYELATNAAKYGAQSNQSGRVDITWSVLKPNGYRQFIFRWQERGGPRVTPPTGKGFGSAVLEQVMAEYFEAPPQIEFAADGVGYEVVGLSGGYYEPSQLLT